MDLDILSWNCRGICNDSTVRALKDLISQNRPQIIFLCETKISNLGDFTALKHALGFSYAKEVLSDGQAGGLGVFWNDEVRVQMGTVSEHHIDMVIFGGPGDPRWRLTCFYGYARTSERDRSWKLLQDLCDLDSLPWVVIGDFNEILNNGEKIDGPVRAERQMRGFRDALGYCDLLDLGFQGCQSTWWNSETQLRLDRAVCTPSWCDLFGYAKVVHLPPSDSDHIPILLRASTIPLPTRPKHHRFKFEAFWLQHAECNPLVEQAWQIDVTGNPMFQVTKKIAYTRMELDKWQKRTFKMRQQQMMGIRTRLEELMDCTITVAVQEEKKDLMDRLHAFLSQEEAFWRQRSKITWLKEGDRNTGFFHRKVANRKRHNTIQGLYDEDGNWVEDNDGMERVVTSYFTTIFTASDVDMEAITMTIEAIQPSVTQEMNVQLCAPYTSEEVKRALFQMYPTKSPGPDGMPPLFFQHYWETIGEDVTEAVCNFLHSVQYSFLVRGRPRGLVTPSRGLRQGDPLSPYLFLLGAEGFSALLQQKQAAGLLPGIEVCNEAPSVNHLLFADDSMLYGQASLEDCFQILEVFETYGRASGQVVNFNKSSVVFSKNVSECMQDEVASLLGVEIVDSHEKYLGLPTYVGRKKTATFQYIKDNLAKKLTNWQGKLLSGAGKDILIRVVAQALPTSMSRLHDYRFHNSKLRSEAIRCLRVEKWKPPSIGTLKVNIDGSFYESTRQGGFGFVIRDSDGQFIVGGGGPLSQLLSPEHAELSAFQAALDYIMEHDMQPVVVETDSTKVQRQLTIAAMPNTSTLGRVYDDLLMLLESQPNVTIVHARRDANNSGVRSPGVCRAA
ncbi:uncharacterized protein LOC112177760 [Rosa chinensis]|uniref:uncharacterized protein LOC112177760 n=1 Tax=Rosa chinensis TaxID=74649 RepID=UPI000D088A2E|nr:uncharacterized protein LOC112177760 [Rosa chinensis]